VTYTPDEIASAIIAEGQTARTVGTPETLHPVISPRGIQIALSTAIVESNDRDLANPNVPASEAIPNDGDGTDHDSAGPFQQQYQWWGTVAEEMDPRLSAAMFYHHLVALPEDYNDPNTSPGTFAQDVQGSAFPARYDQAYPAAVAQYNRLAGAPPVTNPNRPAYNEFPMNSPNSQDRAGTKVDLWLIHTQEGGGGNSAAQDLATFLDNPANQVSYHYAISQASDGGVTVVDVVDTTLASWSVLDANDRSINLCFAGSTVNWTREQWMLQANAIDVAAYLAVQDCAKYGISTNVVPPPYTAGTPGISDHMYVTDILKDGTHVDCGPNFPWDVFAAAVHKYANAPAPAPPAPVPGGNVTNPPQFPQPPATTDAAIMEIWGVFFNAIPSESRYATAGGLYMTKDFINFTDARVHEINVERLALMGEPSCVALVKTAAAAGDSIAALVLSKIPASPAASK
jgi:N-acetyl-anhydromuramyl-L-alanine amidase AmpD